MGVSFDSFGEFASTMGLRPFPGVVDSGFGVEGETTDLSSVRLLSLAFFTPALIIFGEKAPAVESGTGPVLRTTRFTFGDIEASMLRTVGKTVVSIEPLIPELDSPPDRLNELPAVVMTANLSLLRENTLPIRGFVLFLWGFTLSGEAGLETFNAGTVALSDSGRCGKGSFFEVCSLQ